MKNFISGWFGIGIILLICYTPVYIFFFNSAEDAVKEMTLADIIYEDIRLTTDSNDMIKEKKKIVDEFAEEYEERTGINIEKSIYKTLKNDKNVEDVKIILINESKYYAEYVIKFIYKDHPIKLPFAAEKPSFFDIKTAKAHALLSLDEILPLISKSYHIPEYDMKKIYEIFSSALPRTRN